MLLRKYWIPLLVFIVAIVGVSLYYLQTRPPKEPVKIYKVVEPVEKSTEQSTAEVVEGETDTGGHFHEDGTWHEGPHDPQASVDEGPLSPEDAQTLETIDWENLTPNDIMYLLNKKRWPHLTQAQRETVHREFYAQSVGAEPPPEGYYYRIYDDGTLVLDENGKPRQFKEGEPIITIKKVIGFAPTREQYQRYKELTKSYHRAYNAGTYAEADRIQAEIEQLEAEAQGKVPVAFSSIMSPVSRGEADLAAARSKVDAAIDEAYREMGLGYMVDED